MLAIRSALLGLALCILSNSRNLFAEEYVPATEASPAPLQTAAFQTAPSTGDGPLINWESDSGWFAGIGGSFNSVRVDQEFNGTGLSSIYNGSGDLLATGTATGPAPPFHETKTTFAPVAELGYFRNFEDSDWLWGAKFSYKYLGLTLSNQNFDAPQAGSFTMFNPPSTTDFTGNAFTLSAQTAVNHELLLLPFLGHNLRNGRFYIGGGPVVFNTQSRLYGLYSYADINGVRTNIGGPPLNLSSDKWMWGGAGQIGMSYSFHPNLFIDVSYSFMVTGTDTTTWPVTTRSVTGGNTYVTQIEYILQERIWAQSLTASLNLKF